MALKNLKKKRRMRILSARIFLSLLAGKLWKFEQSLACKIFKQSQIFRNRPVKNMIERIVPKQKVLKNVVFSAIT